MATTEILRTFLWNIKLYSHSPDELSIHDDLVAKACKYIGLDLFMLREDLQYEDVLVLIFNYTNRANKLFSKGILEEKADTIISSKFYSAKAFELCKTRYYADVNNSILTGYLEDLHLKINEQSPVCFSDSEKEKVIKDWNERGLEEFRKKVFYRQVMRFRA